MKMCRLILLGGVVLGLASAGCGKVKEAAKKKLEAAANKQNIKGVWIPVWTGAASQAGSPLKEFKDGKYRQLGKDGKPTGWTATYKVERNKLTITWPKGTDLDGEVLKEPLTQTETIKALDDDHMVLLNEEGLGKGSDTPPQNFARLLWRKRGPVVSNRVKIVGVWNPSNGPSAPVEFTSDGKLTRTILAAGTGQPTTVAGTYKIGVDKLEMDIGGKKTLLTIKTLNITDLVLEDEGDKKTEALKRYRISMPPPRE